MMSGVRRSDLRRVVETWWPLAASWLLMGIELPVVSAAAARLPDAQIHLAAYGGVVFPLALIIEAPVIMLLPVATALCKDWASYRRIHKYMMLTGGLLTALHLLVALTPLYDLVVRDLLGVPSEILAPARLGLIIMTPWTWAIAIRRFNQGTLIRFGHSRTVGAGTLVRLGTDLAVLAIGYRLAHELGPQLVPGIAVMTPAIAAGVTAEAVYAALVVRPVLRGEVRLAPKVEPALSLRSYLSFYIPLMLTSLLTLIANPIGSAALSRMPATLPSLATWPVVTGAVFILRSLGMAYNEVVVALLDERRFYAALERFTWGLAVVTTALLALIAATPLANLWFAGFSGLPPDLAAYARVGLILCLPLPALSVLQSWYQGALLHDRRTRAVTESVVIYLVTVGVVYALGVGLNRFMGLYVGLAGMSIAVAAQTAWMALRAAPALRRAATDRPEAAADGAETPAGREEMAATGAAIPTSAALAGSGGAVVVEAACSDD